MPPCFNEQIHEATTGAFDELSRKEIQALVALKRDTTGNPVDVRTWDHADQVRV